MVLRPFLSVSDVILRASAKWFLTQYYAITFTLLYSLVAVAHVTSQTFGLELD